MHPPVPRPDAASGGDPHADTERRLVDLEIKASFSEDLLDSLNAIVAGQQQLIDQLVQQVAALRQQQPSSDPGAFRSLRDELPPHY